MLDFIAIGHPEFAPEGVEAGQRQWVRRQSRTVVHVGHGGEPISRHLHQLQALQEPEIWPRWPKRIVVAGVSVTLDDVEENDAFCSEPVLRTLYRIGVLLRASEPQ